MLQNKQLREGSPHSCLELLGHAEDKRGKEVDNLLFKSQHLIFVFALT